MTARPPGDRPHLLVDDLAAPVLDDDAAHHWIRVRRLRAETSVTITDGQGRWRAARFGADASLAVDGEVVAVPRPDPVTVAFALTKGSKPDLVIQKLTEQGVDRIVPIIAAHSVVRWDDAKAEAQWERWWVIARNAIEQSMGVFLPVIDRLGSVVTAAGIGARRLDRDGTPWDRSITAVAVGPEGGWADDERDLLGPAVSLSANVLRAETAAITVGGILTAVREGVV